MKVLVLVPRRGCLPVGCSPTREVEVTREVGRLCPDGHMRWFTDVPASVRQARAFVAWSGVPWEECVLFTRSFRGVEEILDL